MDIVNSALASSPVFVGVMFFAVALVSSEYFVVYRNSVSDYHLRIIDLVWVCTSAVALLFLLLSEREVRLRDSVSKAENQAVVIRNKLEFLSRRIADICMADQLDKLSVVADYGKAQLDDLERAGQRAYTANGSMMTEQCIDPIFFSTILSVTGADTLWRQYPSKETGENFSIYYKEYFCTTIPSQRRTLKGATDQAIQNGVKATSFFKSQTDELIKTKIDAGKAQDELRIVHNLRSIGFLWPFPLSLALAFRLAKAHHDVRKARPPQNAKPTS